MLRFAIFLSICFLTITSNPIAYFQKPKAGSYALKFTMFNTQNQKEEFPDDSLFAENNIVLERVGDLKIKNTSKTQTRSVDYDTYYLINLKTRQFTDLTSLTSLGKKTLYPLINKKTGYTFDSGSSLFHNEQCEKSEEILNGTRVRKYSFSCSAGPYYGKHITMYLTNHLDNDRPLLIYPDIENKFKGNILMVEIDFENQGRYTFEFTFDKHVDTKYINAIHQAAL